MYAIYCSNCITANALSKDSTIQVSNFSCAQLSAAMILTYGLYVITKQDTQLIHDVIPPLLGTTFASAYVDMRDVGSVFGFYT